MRVDIESGKYTYIFEDGRARLLRYGDPTSRDVVGDKLIYCMAAEISELRQQLAERDEQISDLTISSDTYFAERNSARDVWRRASKDRDELRRQLAESKEEYGRACHLVAQMHAAAVGEVTGPKLGVVEDVAEVRRQLADLTQTSFDLCPECGWRTLIPGEGCLKCATPDPKGAMEISMKQAFGATVRDRYDAEIAELRQQLADRDKQVMLLHFELFNSAEYIDTLGGTSLEARKTLAATEQWK